MLQEEPVARSPKHQTSKNKAPTLLPGPVNQIKLSVKLALLLQCGHCNNFFLEGTHSEGKDLE
jgi:hypothetical protein